MTSSNGPSADAQERATLATATTMAIVSQFQRAFDRGDGASAYDRMRAVIEALWLVELTRSELQSTGGPANKSMVRCAEMLDAIGKAYAHHDYETWRHLTGGDGGA